MAVESAAEEAADGGAVVLLLLHRSGRLSHAKEASGRARAPDTAQVVGAV
jgi:hypothetical protein